MFASRQDAGRKLGRYLVEKRIQCDVVAGLVRGGVIVAAEIAEQLRCPLDVIVVRKIGHPHFREFALGALAEPDVVVLDRSVQSGVTADSLESVIAEESERLADYQAKFGHSRVNLAGKSVIAVDDGLATGATMEAGVLSARKQGAASVVVAVPVASASGFDRLKRVSDTVIAFRLDPRFEAVGQYYNSFPQTTDDEVIAALQRSRGSDRGS